MKILVQEEDFDVGVLTTELAAGAGAVASFVGIVRGGDGGDAITAMTLEHYPGMTERALQAIAASAMQRWQILDVIVIHRTGRLMPGERIVFVGVSARHRGAAFEACEFIMDYLKTEAPFWKKESTPQGERWVDARETDTAARERWTKGDGR